MELLTRIFLIALLALGILAVALIALAALALAYVGLLRLIDYVGAWMDEHPEEKKHG